MKCKCHGVSGSCSIRTCWKGLQDLREIAIDLKTKYLSATKVVHRPMGTRKQLVPKDIDIRPVRENELVYLQSSPDFCTKNEKQGSVGTQDRWDCHVTLCLTASVCEIWRGGVIRIRSEKKPWCWHVGNCQSEMSAHPGSWLQWSACLVDPFSWQSGW